NQTSFNHGKFFFDIDDISADEQTAGAVERELFVRLEYATAYDIFRLQAFSQAISADAVPIQNPPADVAPGDPPLFSFTTPDAFGVPSVPSSGDVIYNELDPTTPDIYDAHVGLRVYAPLSDTGAAQSFRAASVDWVQVTLTRAYPSGTERS